MERLVGVSLNKFSVIPHSLRISGSANVPVDEIFVNLARLYHHYYLDTYGCTPPNPDPAQFEYLRFLSKTQDFKIIGEGLGVSTASRRHRSTELGQAFCRWFLHDHMNITYFAHMSQILDKQLHPGFGNLQVNRKNIIN